MEKALAIRVSIVEDDKRIQTALRTIISGAAEMLITSVHGNAEEAITAIATDCPDVVIMDINLPGASGVECVRELSQRCTGTQFLMYTMHDDDRFVFDALKSGANGYLLKSAKPAEILAAIRELMAGGSPMSAQVARRVVAHMRPVQDSMIADANLTGREQEVLKLLSEGLLYKEISLRLGITEGSIKQHIHRMYEKLHVQNRTEAVNRFFGRKFLFQIGLVHHLAFACGDGWCWSAGVRSRGCTFAPKTLPATRCWTICSPPSKASARTATWCASIAR